MNKKIGFFGFILLLFCGCTNMEIKKEEKPKTVVMPSGWDDSVIEKINSEQSVKKTVAVLEFEGGEKISADNNLKMADILITSLSKNKQYELVERNRLDKIMEEQKLVLSGLVDEKSAIEVGKLSGAEYVVVGNITSATNKVTDKFAYKLINLEVGVDVRVVNATDGKIILSESATGSYQSKLVATADGVVVSGEVDYSAGFAIASKDAIEKIGNKIAKLSPLIGFVVAIEPKRVTIDLGTEQGVIIGDKFVIFRVTDEIFHPVTKKHIGWKKELIAEIKIEKSEKNMSTGIVVIQQPEMAIKVGDYIISK